MAAPAGQRLFHHGDAATVFPLLVEGRVRLSIIGPDGTEVLLYRLAPGESCALSVATLLGEDSYPATATAESTVVLYAVPRALFLQLVLEVGEFRSFVFHGLSQRLAQLMSVLEDVTFRGIAERLATHLLDQPQPLDTTHQMLADDLGTRREVISRILQSFQQAGFIRLARRRIEVLDARALRGMRNSDAAARGSVPKVTDTSRLSV